MSKDQKTKSVDKGAAPEATALIGLCLIGVGSGLEYSWPMAALVVGSVLFVLGVWSAMR